MLKRNRIKHLAKYFYEYLKHHNAFEFVQYSLNLQSTSLAPVQIGHSKVHQM